ncbi:MAG TPA: hypothetical protein VEI95_13275 [Acidobacteriota bacterium]|nr:hypothetical protein [Acidobacteriota bacterium]
MKAIAASTRRSALAILLAILFLPRISGAAQGAKAPVTKAPQAKAAPIDDNATWLLAGHEGECVPLSLLEKKSPEFKGIKGPNQLAEKLRAMGHKTEVKEFKAGIRPAVEVRALSAGIAVMFVRQEHCDRKPAAAGTP